MRNFKNLKEYFVIMFILSIFMIFIYGVIRILEHNDAKLLKFMSTEEYENQRMKYLDSLN